MGHHPPQVATQNIPTSTDANTGIIVIGILFAIIIIYIIYKWKKIR